MFRRWERPHLKVQQHKSWKPKQLDSILLVSLCLRSKGIKKEAQDVLPHFYDVFDSNTRLLLGNLVLGQCF